MHAVYLWYVLGDEVPVLTFSLLLVLLPDIFLASSPVFCRLIVVCHHRTHTVCLWYVVWGFVPVFTSSLLLILLPNSVLASSLVFRRFICSL